MEAEDVIQDAYLRYQATPRESIRSPEAFLKTIVTRLSLDQLKSARTKRETYIGPWLPEPIVTESDSSWMSPVEHLQGYESISMAFLVLLESLTPVERAVFLMREVFDYDYHEVAAVVGKSEVACRKIYSRAKQHVAEHKPRFEFKPEDHEQILHSFMDAIQVGEFDGLMNLLAEDVTLWSDGGGNAAAAKRPVYGRRAVARLYMTATEIFSQALLKVVNVNGKPAIVTFNPDGSTWAVISIDVSDGEIHTIHNIFNPDKLQSIRTPGESEGRSNVESL
jgi:RNA polymerase sigma-70 factor (ECF subfamily)